MKIILIFGAFDPPRKQHIAMVSAARERLKADEVIIFPVEAESENGFPVGREHAEKMIRTAFADEKCAVSQFADGNLFDCIVAAAERFADKKTPEISVFVFSDVLSRLKRNGNCDNKICDALKDAATEGKILTFSGVKPPISAQTKVFTTVFSCAEDVKEQIKNVPSTFIKAEAALGIFDKCLPKRVAEYAAENGVYKTPYSDFLIESLKESRRLHTAGVVSLALTYAQRLKVSLADAYTAAILHDCAKYLVAADWGYETPEGVPEPVVHQFLGAYIAENVLDVKNKDVLNAIRYHTTGRKNMSQLEKIVFLADLLERGRTYEEADALRAAVDKDFESGFVRCVDRMYKYLLSGGGEVYYLTKECRDYYVAQSKNTIKRNQ